MNKNELRRYIRRLKKEQTIENLRRWSAEACDTLSLHSHVAEADTIVAYYPLPDELDIVPLLYSLVKAGKRVLLPRVASDTEMELCVFDGPSTLREGAFGILEPNTPAVNLGKTNETPQNKKITILVPGMAFTSDGRRLGRGKGYYDRFLGGLNEQSIEIYKIGVCYPYQLLENLPSAEHDMVMDEVIRVN